MIKKFDKKMWVTVPHIYVDTNVYAEIIEGQHRASIHLLETVKEKKWRCSTSIFTLMELSEIRQDNKYVYNQLGLGTHIKKAFRALDQKDLSPSELTQTQEKIDTLFIRTYPFLEFFSLEEKGWDRALELKATTNISASDAIHLATALEAGCDIPVTLDTFLIKEASSFMKTCPPEQTNRILKELGFDI